MTTDDVTALANAMSEVLPTAPASRGPHTATKWNLWYRTVAAISRVCAEHAERFNSQDFEQACLGNGEI